MIDIRFLRENPEVVKQNIRNKFQDSKLALVDEVIELDAESRKIKGMADDLRAQRNKYSKEIGKLFSQGKREEAEEMKKLGCDRVYVEGFKENPNSFFGWIYFTITFCFLALISYFFILFCLFLCTFIIIKFTSSSTYSFKQIRNII